MKCLDNAVLWGWKGCLWVSSWRKEFDDFDNGDVHGLASAGVVDRGGMGFRATTL